MSIAIRKSVIVMCVVIAGTMLFWGIISPPKSTSAIEQITPQDTATDPYLELSVEPRIVAKGALVSLMILYHYIGLPYTYINVNPPDLVAYDPLITMPCKYNEHPNGCKVITLRALSSGEVQIRASATGEIFDESCSCWRWSVASDNGPASLTILDTIWYMFIPSILR